MAAGLQTLGSSGAAGGFVVGYLRKGVLRRGGVVRGSVAGLGWGGVNRPGDGRELLTCLRQHDMAEIGNPPTGEQAFTKDR